MVCKYYGKCELSYTYPNRKKDLMLLAKFQTRYCRESAFAESEPAKSSDCPHYKALERISELEGIISRTKTQP